MLALALTAGMAMAFPQGAILAAETDQTETVTAEASDETQASDAPETAEQTETAETQGTEIIQETEASQAAEVAQTPETEQTAETSAASVQPIGSNEIIGIRKMPARADSFWNYSKAKWTWSPDDSWARVEVPATRYPDVTTSAYDRQLEKKISIYPTCTEDGIETLYASCKVGDRTLQAMKQNKLPARGHRWENPQWTWSTDYSAAQATFTCWNNESHKKTADAAVLKTVTKEPTCTEDGEVVYTATADAPDAQYTGDPENLTTTVTASIPATGHDWGEARWTWNEDYTQASVTRVCSHDPDHAETADAQITWEDKDGKRLYTAAAVLDGETLTDTRETVLPEDARETVQPEKTVKTAGVSSEPKTGKTVIRTVTAGTIEPQTGDTADAACWGGMMAAAGAAMIAVSRRNKKEEKQQ